MKYTNALLIVLIPLFMTSCKINIEIPESGGRITTASGSFNCASGEVCTIDVVDIFFDETFVAEPSNGFVFSGWRRKDRGLCGGNVSNCHLYTSDFSGIEGLMAFLENPDEIFYLEPTFQRAGFNSLFIGHSFFIPIARTMPLHAEAAGVEYHTQTTVFSGGSSGAPEAMWNNAEKSEEIRLALDAGGIDLFAMTYHGDYPTLTGYTGWINYALEKNPATHIAIGLPWSPYPESTDSISYGSGWKAAHTSAFHDLIDQLKALYPDTNIFCIPYGQSAVELRDLYAVGNLDDVQALLSDSVESIYNDTLGHGDGILLALSELVWLSAIYGVDLSAYTYEPEFNADLKAIAQGIMAEHDPTYNAVYN